METIAYLDQHELGFFDESDQPLTFERKAARAVLRNADNQVAVMYFTSTGSYKLPGGGVDDGEEPRLTLDREVQEEAGYSISNVKELGIVEENRYSNSMHQISYCYTADIVDFVGTALTEEEASQGMELRWVNTIDEAISAIESGHVTDEEGSVTGLEMMKTRDIAILRAAQAQITK